MVMLVLAGRIVYMSCDAGEHLTGQYDEHARHGQAQAKPRRQITVQGVSVSSARGMSSGS